MCRTAHGWAGSLVLFSVSVYVIISLYSSPLASDVSLLVAPNGFRILYVSMWYIDGFVLQTRFQDFLPALQDFLPQRSKRFTAYVERSMGLLVPRLLLCVKRVLKQQPAALSSSRRL